MTQTDSGCSSISIHSIAPAQVIRGSGAWIEAQKSLSNLFRNPLLLGRSESTQSTRSRLSRELNQSGLRVFEQNLEHDCCELDLQRLQKEFVRQSCDGVIAAGGGKVLDSGKLLADRLDFPASQFHSALQPAPVGQHSRISTPQVEPSSVTRPSSAARTSWFSTTTCC